jgi:hypothetical protein
MNTSSRNIVDTGTTVNPSSDRRGDAASQAAVSLWQKTIDDKTQSVPTMPNAPVPQKAPGGNSNVGPDVLQQSQFLSRFGRAGTMGDSVSEQSGILAQVGTASAGAVEQDPVEALVGGAPQTQTAEKDTVDGVAYDLSDDMSDESIDEVDAVDPFDANNQFERVELSQGEPSIKSVDGAKQSGMNATDIRQAEHLTSLVERFADRFLLELDAGTSMKQMQMQLNATHLPDTSLVLQQSGNLWTLRAQTKSSEVGDKLKLAESSLKERFRARGLGDINLDVYSDEREAESSEFV